MISDAVDTRAAAKLLGVSASYLTKKRCTGGGPTFRKIGRRVVYRLEDLEQFLSTKARLSTSEAA